MIIALIGIISILVMIVFTEFHYQIYSNYEKTLLIASIWLSISIILIIFGMIIKI